jgi:hypothetical protein
VTAPDGKPQKGPPLYWRILRLRHVRPNSWQRAAFFEGSLAVAAVLVLADLASAWLLLVLPVAVAAVVKGHDVLVGWLDTDRHEATEPVQVISASSVNTPGDGDTGAAGVVQPAAEAKPDPEPVPEPEPEPEQNVRVVPAAPKPRAARARPGAAAARAQVSAHAVRGRRPERKPGDAKSSG